MSRVGACSTAFALVCVSAQASAAPSARLVYMRDGPLVDRGGVLWVPTMDHSMVRRHRLDDGVENALTGEEVVLDPRREILSLAADDCNVYRLSRSSFDAAEPNRVMVHAR